MGPCIIETNKVYMKSAVTGALNTGVLRPIHSLAQRQTAEGGKRILT